MTKDIYIYGTEFPVCPIKTLKLHMSLSSLNTDLNDIQNSNELLLMMANSATSKKVSPLPYEFCEDEYFSK